MHQVVAGLICALTAGSQLEGMGRAAAPTHLAVQPQASIGLTHAQQRLAEEMHRALRLLKHTLKD